MHAWNTRRPSRAVLGLLLMYAPAVRAVGFDFDIESPTIISGSGETIIEKEYPALQGQGLGPQLEVQIQPTLDDLIAQVKSEVKERLDSLDFGPFLRSTANAAALSSKAAPVDHANAFRIFSLSFGGGAGLSGLSDLGSLKSPSTLGDQIKDGRAPRFGVAPEASILLGFHMGLLRLPAWKYFDLNRMEVYVNVFKLNLGGGERNWAVGAGSYGGHLKYQVMLGRTLAKRGLVRWHGLNVITGLNYTDQTVRVTTTLAQSQHSETVQYYGQNLTTTASWQGTAHFRAQMKTFTIPIEVASSIQLAYAFTFYGGLGVDFNIGRASLQADARAPVDVTVTGPSGRNPTEVSRPVPRLNYNEFRRPAPVDGRAFVGLQLGYKVAGLFVQASADTSKSVAAHAGLRAFW